METGTDAWNMTVKRWKLIVSYFDVTCCLAVNLGRFVCIWITYAVTHIRFIFQPGLNRIWKYNKYISLADKISRNGMLVSQKVTKFGDFFVCLTSLSLVSCMSLHYQLPINAKETKTVVVTSFMGKSEQYRKCMRPLTVVKIPTS